MGRIQTDPDQLHRTPIPEEIYDAVVSLCDGPRYNENLKGNEVLWGFRITGTPTGLEDHVGSIVFQNTLIEPNRGDQFLQFTQALGVNSRDFETEEAVGTDCKVRIKQRQRKNPDTGEMDIFNNVATVFQAE